MARKQSEVRFRELAKHHGFAWHKYRDVSYCIHCHKPLPKSELKPDFLLACVYTWIECKNDTQTGTWGWTELAEGGDRIAQREWLDENGGWLFIELGQGKAPKGKGAWLVSWEDWKEEIEPQLIERDQKSLRMETVYNKDGSKRRNFIGADLLLSDYALEWEPNIGWTIPQGHVFWLRYLDRLCLWIDVIQEHYIGYDYSNSGG